MSASASRFESVIRSAAHALAPIRVDGALSARFGADGGVTRITDLSERGGWRLRFPATHAPHVEATQINTGGGILGGDRLAVSIDADDGADVVLSTQSAERIYRSMGPEARVDVALRVGNHARLVWLPQETIVFSGARLARRFDVDLAPDATLLMAECLIFGRIASGETLGEGSLADIWRIRRGGRLLYADATRLTGPIADLLARPAIAAGARALAIVLYVAPDAHDRLTAVRAALGEQDDCGASAWNGMLTVRVMSADPGAVRSTAIRVAHVLDRRGMPRVWSS